MSKSDTKKTVSPASNSTESRLIMGTAGHIDHGKTALVRALTGHDCDTHREETQRGITIHLGFTHLEVGSHSIGVVDVPGHAAFVRTMVAGAGGIDFALLVVAADSGVMPQTYEHLQIMDILGIRGGLVAITKSDLVEEEIVEMAREEIREALSGTFLESAPIVAVSAKTAEGLETLREEIVRQAERIRSRPAGEVFRMYVDRVFSVKGFGTVVTGSVLSGELSTGDTAYVLPKGETHRVRRLEHHGKEVPTVRAGYRASINLAGLEYSESDRGMVISDRELRSTTLLDAELRLFDTVRPVNIWSRAIFHLGTYEAQVRIHLLDRNQARSGDVCLVQIHLPSPCIMQAGDRFVLRSTSRDMTIGGGEIIDPFPLHHRRRPTQLIETIRTVAEGSLPELIAAQISKRPTAVSAAEIADTLNIAESEIRSTITDRNSGAVRWYEDENSLYLLTPELDKEWRRAVLRLLSTHHKRNPLVATGRTVGDIGGSMGHANDRVAEGALTGILESLRKEKKVKAVGGPWALADHEPTLDAGMRKLLDTTDAYFQSYGMKTPIMADARDWAGRQGMDEREFRNVLRYLVDQGRLHAIEGTYVHEEVTAPVRKRLLEALHDKPEGLTVAQFRDLIGGNRKICLLFYSLFDREEITVREGDVRRITSDGRKLLEEWRKS